MSKRPVKRNRAELSPLPTRRLDTRALPSFQDEPLSVDRAVGAVSEETRRLPVPSPSAPATPRPGTAHRARWVPKQGLRKDGQPDGRVGREHASAGVIREPSQAPARVITRDGVTPQVLYTNPNTGKTKSQDLAEPIYVAPVNISQEDFVKVLHDVIQTLGSRRAVAEGIGVPIRSIFRWQKGLPPKIDRMADLFEKLSALQRPTVY